MIIASSSSGLTMSEIQSGAASHPERCVIAHPFNPPHLIPLVEIVGGAKTSEATIRRAAEFYTSIGQRTVRLNKEMPGHVANRLQAALAREVYYLVAEGVVSAADVDTALSWGPGLRWGIMGNMMLNHLGGGPGGIEHFFQQFTGPMTAWWKTLGSPVLTPEVQKKLIDSVHAEVGSRSIEELEAERDEILLGLHRAAHQGCQVEPNEIDGAGRLRPGAAGAIDHIRHVLQFFRLSRPQPQEFQMPTATAASKTAAPKPLPVPNSDFYQLADVLTAEEKAIVKKVRTFMETKVAPIINKYWSDDAFPFELLPAFKELGIGGLGYEGYGCAGGSQKLFGFVAMEMARVDASFCTFFGVHSGLAMGSIYLDGSEEQKQKWLPPMARLEKIGCFGLTEPLVGSGASGGLTTTAKREGDTWILNGQKRWIGNAPWCDVSIIWARDVADNQVKGFIVENKTTPGFSVEKIENKIALKVVQNGQITLKDVRVPEANRLQGGNSFRDTARVLRMTRYMVGWAATGCQMGAYEARAQIRPGATAVRQADRLVPAGAGPARQDARQHHGLPVPDGAAGAAG